MLPYDAKKRRRRKEGRKKEKNRCDSIVSSDGEIIVDNVVGKIK